MTDTKNQIITCNIKNENILNILQCGIAEKNSFFYISHSLSSDFIFEYVTSGKGYIMMNDKMYTVKKGDFYIIPSHRSYEYFTDSVQPYERIWFFGNGALLENLYQTYFDRLPLAVASIKNHQPILDILSILKHYDNSKKMYTALSHEILTIFLETKENLTVSNRAHRNAKSNTASKIKSYLYTHCSEKFDLSKLSAEFSLSPNQMINVFRSTYNTTPQVFHTMLKISVAEEMLINGSTNKDIATLLGFSDERYFSRVFKKYKQVTPTYYKNHPDRTI